jgi:hypothetical protein
MFTLAVGGSIPSSSVLMSGPLAGDAQGLELMVRISATESPLRTRHLICYVCGKASAHLLHLVL